MAESIPLKFYKGLVNGQTYYIVNPGTNTPYGMSEANYDEWAAYAKQNKVSAGENMYDYYIKQYPGLENYNTNPNVDSGYVWGDNGAPWLKTAYESEMANKAAVAAGTMVNVGTESAPKYMPTNSPGVQNLQGKTTEQIMATQAGKDFVANNPGVKPVTTPAPTQQTAPGTTATPAYTPLTPSALQLGTNLKESDLARTTGLNIYQRDLAGEQKAIGEYIKMTGKTPSSSQDWLQFHDYVYEGKKPTGMVTGPAGNVAGMAAASGQKADTGKVSSDQQTSTSLLDQYGLNIQEGKSPTNTFADAYKQLYASLGLDTLKENILNINKEIEALESERMDKINEVSDNPWLSQALQTRKIQAVNDKYDVKKQALTARQQLDQSMFESGQEEARYVASQTLDIYFKNLDYNHEMQLRAMELAESRADAERQMKQDLINFEEESWTYVKTPAERDQLRAKGYEIVVRDGKTYAKAPAIKKSSNSASTTKIKVGDTWGDGYSEGDIIEYNGSFYSAGVDGKWRKATTEEKNSLTNNSDGLTPEEKIFQKELAAEQNKLAKGGDWGDSWNYLMNKYSDAGLTNEALDQLLNKDKYYPR